LTKRQTSPPRVSGVYAAGLLRGRTDAHHRLGFTIPFAFASVAAIVQPFVGHVLGLQVGGVQASKLAAFELALHTEQGPAPERIGGVLIDGEVRWALPIPWIGSFIARGSFDIARGSFDAPVPGLDTIPKSDWPPVNLTHLSFQLMVAIGKLLALVVVVFWLARRRGHDLLGNRWFLRFCVIAGPLAIFALELGVGRHRSGSSAVDRLAGVAHHRRGQHELRVVVELHRRADHLPRHDHRGGRRAAVDSPAMARRGRGPAQPVQSGRVNR
jgi:cytochrome bd-type quinol oxidase subunit 1